MNNLTAFDRSTVSPYIHHLQQVSEGSKKRSINFLKIIVGVGLVLTSAAVATLGLHYINPSTTSKVFLVKIGNPHLEQTPATSKCPSKNQQHSWIKDSIKKIFTQKTSPSSGGLAIDRLTDEDHRIVVESMLDDLINIYYIPGTYCSNPWNRDKELVTSLKRDRNNEPDTWVHFAPPYQTYGYTLSNDGFLRGGFYAPSNCTPSHPIDESVLNIGQLALKQYNLMSLPIKIAKIGFVCLLNELSLRNPLIIPTIV